MVEKACTCFICVQDLYMMLNSLSWHQTGKTGYCEENRLKPVSDRISENITKLKLRDRISVNFELATTHTKMFSCSKLDLGTE